MLFLYAKNQKYPISFTENMNKLLKKNVSPILRIKWSFCEYYSHPAFNVYCGFKAIVL